MVTSILRKLFGSRNQRLVRQYRNQVEQINALEPTMKALSDEQLQAKTNEFRARFTKGETLEKMLPEAFAVVREASSRVMGMRHFDVQMIGGMVLNAGKIAEMRTGEGKTLTATLAVYLNAIPGKGVHVVTVNDYLAERDAAWMGKLYNFLGMSVGTILSHQSTQEKLHAYRCDITYGTNNEYGFDYLRDNMEYRAEDRRQRELFFAIVDEVDSILIDEARTPLIISGQAEDHTDLYLRLNSIPKMLTPQTTEPKAMEPDPPGDFYVDEKGNQVHISEAGFVKCEEILAQMGILAEGASLYDPANILLLHHLQAALKAHYLFHKDQHYVVQEGEVVIVDEFTGRLMSGRRWSDGLHQAVEAKEGVEIQPENQTLASITFQNYFRMYSKLSGMTGTADTEAYEFQQIYGLETVVIPTHRPVQRKDGQDKIYMSADEKHDAIIADIRSCHERGQPVLVGTASIESSELLSSLLERENLPHQVLNAKQHEREAEIIAQAGSPGVITIATNMAGRGTDIVLGGNIEKKLQAIEHDEALTPEQRQRLIEEERSKWKVVHDQVLTAGGLHIIGSERHESRRIDNQLRGRAGRQGDAGSSQFYLSMDDTLLRIFAGDRMRGMMARLNLPKGEAIEHPWVSRSIESAQRKVEGRNFDIRKQLLEYDDVSNEQRKVIYRQRNEVLDNEDIGEMITNMREGVLTNLFHTFVPQNSMEEQWNIADLTQILKDEWDLDLPLAQMLEDKKEVTDEDLLQEIIKAANESYQAKVDLAGRESFASYERSVFLQTLDSQWREHLSALDHLRQGIHLRGYAQKNPKQEYKREAFELFENMLDTVSFEIAKTLQVVKVRSQEELEAMEAALDQEHIDLDSLDFQHDETDEDNDDNDIIQHFANANNVPVVGRNDPCPCGSGLRYKHCHGKIG